MSVILELEKRVEEAQEKLSAALAELSTFADFKKRLAAAGAGLSSSSSALMELAQKVESHTESLSEAAKSLSAAVVVMKQTDFGEIRNSLQGLKLDIHECYDRSVIQVQALAEDIGKAALSNHQETVSQLTQTCNRLSGEIRDSEASTRSSINVSLAEKFEKVAGSTKNQAFVTWALISICIVLMSYSIMLGR